MPEDSLERLTPEQRQELSLGRLARQLLTNPETRDSTAKLLQKQDASLRFPDVEAKEELRKATEKSDAKIADLEKSLRERDARAALEKQHAKIRDKGMDVSKVNEIMEKHGIPSTSEGYDIVIELLENRQALAEPTPDSVAPLQVPNIKEMWNDPVKWREQQGYKVLNELIAQRKRA